MKINQLMKMHQIVNTYDSNGFSFIGFQTIHRILAFYTKHGHIANNFTALFHALFASQLAGIHILSTLNKDQSRIYLNHSNIYRLLQCFCSGYFSYDMYYTLRHREMNVSTILYCYHHLASIYLLSQDPSIYKANHVMFWAELSNIPSYFVYYYLKQPSSTYQSIMLKRLRWLQFCLYTFIRFPILTYLTYRTYSRLIREKRDKTPIHIVFPVYVMGLFWSGNLYKQLT